MLLLGTNHLNENSPLGLGDQEEREGEGVKGARQSPLGRLEEERQRQVGLPGGRMQGPGSYSL